tara:strand:+ start:226 stop:441 length:216 start_codon:yes stop_codon:yes gene_type:complete
MGTGLFHNPLQNLLFHTYNKQGYPVRDMLLEIFEMSDQDILKELKKLGVRPDVIKKAGGMVERNPYLKQGN